MDGDLSIRLEEIFKNRKFSHVIYHTIFKIFKEEGEKYSKNLNGVFINLNDCKEETLVKVYDYIGSIEKINIEHENYLKKTEKTIDDFKKILKEDKKPAKKQYYVKRSKKTMDVENKILDKELVPEKQVYNGVYKRIYNSMKGYKNKPQSKKELELDTHIDVEDTEEIEDIVEIEIEDHEDVEAEVEDLNDELFGNDSDTESVKKD
jgi:hypothetical protein